MYSPISSGLMRFSMLSLTFCSWPDRVWMTNHWLRMVLELKEHEQPEEHLIHQHDEATQHNDGNASPPPSSPSTHPRSARCICATPPASAARNWSIAAGSLCAREPRRWLRRPRPRSQFLLDHSQIHSVWRRGRDSNPRRRLSRSGFQDRRDRPLCHLSGCRRLAGREGLEPPTNGFGDRYSTN